MVEITYRDALRQALHDAMLADGSVVVTRRRRSASMAAPMASPRT